MSRLALALALASLSSLAHAQSVAPLSPINPERPGFTNGPATVGKKVLQLEESISQYQRRTVFGDGGFLRYGVTDTTEVRLGLPNWERRSLFSPASYGIKHTLTEQLGVIVQTSGERPTQTLAAVEGEFSLPQQWTLQVDVVRDASWSGGLNLGRPLTERLSFFIEGYRSNGWHGDGGLMYRLTPDQQVDLSGGDQFVSLGFSWRFRG